MDTKKLQRGQRVTVRHSTGFSETATVIGWTHTPDHPQIDLRMDDDTYYTSPAFRVHPLRDTKEA